MRKALLSCSTLSCISLTVFVGLPPVQAEEQQTLTNPQPINWLDSAQPLERLLEPVLPEPHPLNLLPLQVHLVLKLSDRKLYVYQGEWLQASYPVAVGRPDWETPTGIFQVRAMMENPSWMNPFTEDVVQAGQENPLGDRWIAFWTDGTNEIGFHGTPNRDSVGQAVSHGCVRMYNEDIRELYEQVMIGTQVIVEP